MGYGIRDRGCGREPRPPFIRLPDPTSQISHRTSILQAQHSISMAHSLHDGIAALRAGDFSRAAELLREAADADAGDVKARMALGAALGEMGQWDEAVAALREATALSPRSAPAHYNLGSALERAGRTEEARAAYRDAVRIDPL